MADLESPLLQAEGKDQKEEDSPAEDPPEEEDVPSGRAPRSGKSAQGPAEDPAAEEDAAPQEGIFWTKFRLAVSMSFWVTLFYVPLIIPPVHQWFFVDMDIPNLLSSPDFESYWPNTVQLIVFTVYFSTGSTVNLAWQGLAGTVVAGLNQVFMGMLFPQGGKCLKVAPYKGTGIRGFCEEFADPRYGEFEWFVWFDVFFFLFLLLSSNAKENTMKFGMSWHLVYMMAFMSPTGYQPSHAVNITTVFGVSLAILITLVPSKGPSGIVFKQMVANNLVRHPMAIAKTVGEMSRGTVKFMLASKPETASERYHYKVDRVAIEQKVDLLEGMAKAMSDDWSVSWWEGWLYNVTGGPKAVTEFRRIRTHCGIFASAFQDDIGGFDDVAYVMQKVVSAVDAKSYKFMPASDVDELDAEREQMRGYVEGLNAASNALLATISDCRLAPKGAEDMKAYAERIELMKQDIDRKFADLFGAYSQWRVDNPVADKSATRQILRSNMSVFVFSVMQLSKEVMDLSDTVVAKYRENVSFTEGDLMKQTLTGVWHEFISTYVTGNRTPAVVKALTDGDKRSFVFRNLISISLCFTLGNVLQGSVFATPFNPLLAGTLAVLISHFPGSAFYKNLMRLLGLAIGNALPVVIMAPVSLCGPGSRPYAHLAMFFLFEFYFGLMYYTSPEWSYIGCIVAGFGCYSFTTDTWSPASFDAAYCKIGQVTAAITIQIIVDMLDTKLRKKFPQDIVVANMRTLTTRAVQVFERFKEHMRSPEPSPAVMESIKAMAGELKGLMAGQEQLVSECQAKTIMIAGPGPSFQLDLYTGSLKAIKNILSEADALCLVDEFSEKVGLVKAGEWFTPDYVAFYDQLLDTMRQTFATLMLILERKDEALVPKNCVRICLTDEDPTHQSTSVRMAVVKRIMGDLLQHVLEIEHLCCKSGRLEFQI